MKRAALLTTCLLALAAGGILALSQTRPFPHRTHEGLFPVCTGCHAGILEGDTARFYPSPESCEGCHDGERRAEVRVAIPGPRASNLRFSHPEHRAAAQDAGGPSPECQACHSAPGETARMAVQPASPAACLACHEAPSHLAAGRDCTLCHRPLAAAASLPPERIARFPAPADHDEPGFLLGHDPEGAVDRCATCHARESCTRCHLNGDDLSAVRALAPDPRVAALGADRPPRYPRPPSHEGDTWAREHDEAFSEDPAECASCHVRESCASCHVEEPPPGIAALPEAPPEPDRRGVRLAGRGVVHWPGFAGDHGPAAAAEGACTSCHRASFCESCHAAAASPPFHLPDFLERHGPEAYSAAIDCQSCHNTEVFCRACHTGMGLDDERRQGVTFHSSRPFWLLGHGTAARQGLEGCVTCHDQGDCATCHSAAFGWRVNPHGPSFDAERAREANPFSCARCHRGGTQ